MAMRGQFQQTRLVFLAAMVLQLPLAAAVAAAPANAVVKVWQT